MLSGWDGLGVLVLDVHQMQVARRLVLLVQGDAIEHEVGTLLSEGSICECQIRTTCELFRGCHAQSNPHTMRLRRRSQSRSSE